MGGSMFHLSYFERAVQRHAARRTLTLILLLAFGLGTCAAQKPGNPATKSLAGFGSHKTSPAKASAPAPPSPPETTEAPSLAIPLPDISSRAEDLSRTLRELSDQLPTSEQLDAMKATLAEREQVLQAKQKEVNAMLAGTPGALEFREQLNYWRELETDIAASRPELLAWANAAQSAIQQVDTEQPKWAATLEQNKSTPDLGPVLDLIGQSVNDIQQLKTRAQHNLRTIVNLQVQAAAQDQIALEIVDRLDKASAHLDERLLERDSLPLWRVGLRRQQGEKELFVSTIATRMIGIRAFFREHVGAIVGLCLIWLLSLFGAYRLHAATRHLQPKDDQQAQALSIVHHWFALAVLPPLLFGYILAPSAPVSLISLAVLVSFLPILVLLPPLIESQLRVPLYWLAVVYALNAAFSWWTISPVYLRSIKVLVNLALIVVLVFLLRRSHLSAERRKTKPNRILILGIRIVVGTMLAAVTANILGYVKLSQYLGVVIFYSAFIALSAITALRVFKLLLEQGIDTPAAQQLAAVRQHRDGIIRWAPRLLKWFGILLWLGATLELLNIREPIDNLLASILDFRIAGGAANITLGSILGLFATLLLGFAFSSGLRFVLREDVLKRFHMARGLPELISSTLHYLFLVLVFLFAVNTGGIELNKFTVLTGALGVGVGFGMQNIVNNFISGLILQFERPIHIGDVLDVDGATGTVTRIGIRSSTVLTFQGSEVIIPNGNFISGKVINWTLSESRRRVDLPVGVAYGTDPKLVKEMLERPANQHPDVLTAPAPEAFFMGFGDSALNFELRFWVMQESNTVKVKSEVALEVMKLFEKAGIEIPFPQRDLRVRSVDPSAAGLLLPNGPESDPDLEPEEQPKGRIARER